MLQPISVSDAKSRMDPLFVPSAVTVAWLIVRFSLVLLFHDMPYMLLLAFTVQLSMVRLVSMA